MTHVAPLVAGFWPRRLGGRPGPFSAPGGSGDSPNGSVLQVELFVDGAWVDITSYVMTRDGSYNVSISRGQPNEATRTDPGRCSFQLNNRDGRFSPRNPTGPYFGKLGRNQPIRVSVPSGNDKSYRFRGEVAELPQRWDTTGTDVWVEVQAAGVLRRLGQGSARSGSTLYQVLSSGTVPVIAYWPFEDASGSTSIASGLSGVQPMVIAGAPSLAAYSGFTCSSPIPTCGTGSFIGQFPSYTAPSSIEVSFLLHIPSGGITSQDLMSFSSDGTLPTWSVYYDATFDVIHLYGKDSGGTTIVDASLTSVDGFVDIPHLISAVIATNGSNLDCHLEKYQVGSFSVGSSGTITATSQTFGVIRNIRVAPTYGLGQTAIGHVWAQSYDPFFVDTHFNALNAYVGETAGARISRMAGLADVDFDSIGTLADTLTMGTQASDNIVSLIEQAVAVDGGILYELTSSLGLGYRTRASLENQSAALALSYTGFNLSEVPEPVDDDQLTRNDIVVSRTGGSSSRATLTSGPLSVLPVPAGIGSYPDAVTLNVESDDDLPDQAGWRLHLGTVDEARFPQISVNLAHPTFTSNPTLRNQVLAVRPGDRITVTGQMPGQAPDDVSQIVLGYSETIDHFQHRITFNCRPESPYRVAVADDATFGRADTDGSQLAADVTSAATSLSVATTSGPLWTTSAPEFPFDIQAGGEVMTVTNITGGSSPQTFTVTRSVNGVVKTQPAGTDVRLHQPAIAAL